MAHFKTCTPSNMSKSAFIATFADIYEHSAWVAEQTFALGISEQHDDIDVLHTSMQAMLAKASKDQKLNLINAHPDLAGKAAIEGTLTAASTHEQAGAGIDQCTAQEFELFSQLNRQYKEKFNFPFIMAVKGSKKALILSAFTQRIDNSISEEFEQAICEINKIALFRLNEL